MPEPIVIRITPAMQAEMQESMARHEVLRRERVARWQEYRRGLLTAEEYAEGTGYRLVGEDEVGLIAASDDDGRRFYVTECCGASAKGVEDGVACRSCYQLIDPALGGIPPNGDTVDPATLPPEAVARAQAVLDRWMSSGMNLGLLRDFIAAAIAEG